MNPWSEEQAQQSIQMMKDGQRTETRKEILRLAAGFSDSPDEVIQIAAKFEAWVSKPDDADALLRSALD